MISDKINSLIVVAMKTKDEIRLSTLRLLSAALHNKKIDKGRGLTQEEEIEIIRREAKMRKDAIEAYVQAGAKEQAEREKKELAILQEYLPAQLSDKELEKLVSESVSQTNASGIEDMGKVMGEVMTKAKGRVEGERVAEMVKAKLT